MCCLSIHKPHRLRQGSVIGVVAPSLPVLDSHREGYARGKQVLEEWGYQVKEGRTINLRRWWSAGTPAERAADLNAMFADPDVDAIIAHTGGFSAIAVLDQLDYDLIRRHPKPFLGISDITIYHLAFFVRCGLIGFHAGGLSNELGTFLSELPPAQQDYVADVYRALLRGPEPLGELQPLTSWSCWRPGKAKGMLIGGCLKRFTALIGSPYFPPLDAFDGAILFWEEIGETLYDITLNLHKLRLLGVLDRIAGMIVGKLTWVNEFFPEIVHPSPRDAVLDVLGTWDFPILAEVDFGHRCVNLPMPIGVQAGIDATACRLSLLEGAVS